MHIITKHAKQRKAQRQISSEDINLCFKYGELIHQRGAEVYYLSRKRCEHHNLPESCQGLAIILDRLGDVIVSVFRTDNKKRLTKTSVKVKRRQRLSKRQLYYQQKLVQSAAL